MGVSIHILSLLLLSRLWSDEGRPTISTNDKTKSTVSLDRQGFCKLFSCLLSIVPPNFKSQAQTQLRGRRLHSGLLRQICSSILEILELLYGESVRCQNCKKPFISQDVHALFLPLPTCSYRVLHYSIVRCMDHAQISSISTRDSDFICHAEDNVG